MSYSIDSYGYPLGFKFKTGEAPSTLTSNQRGREVIKVEACHLIGHQREAILTEGGGSSWRLTSDEGLHLKGTDLAPFPFGYFNAGLQADLLNRIRYYSNLFKTPLTDLSLKLDNEYWLLGSFVNGNGRGVANPSQIEIRIKSNLSDQQMSHLMNCAINASPGIAFLKSTLKSTFSLTINGRRKILNELIDPMVEIPQDPFLNYSEPLRPINIENPELNIIRKLPLREEGKISIAPPGSLSKIIRNIKGQGRFSDSLGRTEIESWLTLPGMSHFLFVSDEGESSSAPSGLGLLSAGIAFCFITQIARYIENMKLDVNAIRLVQFNPFSIRSGINGSSNFGEAEPIETHLFLNGTLSEEMFEGLLNMSSKTCYLHATALNSLPPKINIIHNSKEIIASN
jgi:uncharacterized OsmC-like protein